MTMNEPAPYVSPSLRGKLCREESMRRHTSWRAGGVAQCLYQAADLADLQVFLGTLPVTESVWPVGLGSNLLVRDGGVAGTGILLHGALNELCVQPDRLIYVQAGVPGAKLARYAALNNFQGAEFCAGIPGTLGGMLAMNAGCYGSEIWQHVVRVQLITRSGEFIERVPAEYHIGYRSVALRGGDEEDSGMGKSGFVPASFSLLASPSEFFVGAWLKFLPGDAEVSRKKIKALLSQRIASQPLNLPNAGSVFRNPPNDYAARLIESCGLKGRKRGSAQVSEKHANFIVNTGGATAENIEGLIVEVRDIVEAQTGVVLHPEVKIIGENKTDE